MICSRIHWERSQRSPLYGKIVPCLMLILECFVSGRMDCGLTFSLVDSTVFLETNDPIAR